MNELAEALYQIGDSGIHGQDALVVLRRAAEGARAEDEAGDE